MLSRLIPKPSHLRRFFYLPSKPYPFPPQTKTPNLPLNSFFAATPKPFSTNNNNSNDGNGKDPFSPVKWRGFGEGEEKMDSFFDDDAGSLAGMKDDEETGGGSAGAPAGKKEEEEEWWLQEKGLDDEDEDAIFKGIDKESGEGKGVGDFGSHLGMGAMDFKPWSLKEEKEDEVKDDVFRFQEEGGDDAVGMKGEFDAVEGERSQEDVLKLEKEEKELSAILKGPNRAFGDLIAASGITDEMLDSLIALKDFEGVEGLPPLSVIEDMRYERNTRKSTRAEIERLKQEEAAKSRVRQVDEKGRSYGTGRRKCSIARVWVQPGNGKFIVNDKEFDVYFPMLEHRATLLRPFSETKTLGLWDVNCTVKGGGVSGQVGAIRLGISKALQSWEPDLRPALRNAGFLTRDPRVVERKKPGKAKARKSFQWVKR